MLLFGSEVSGLGYLLKDRVADVDEFVAAVHRVARGGTALDGSIVAELQTGVWPDSAQEVLLAVAADAAVIGD